MCQKYDSFLILKNCVQFSVFNPAKHVDIPRFDVSHASVAATNNARRRVQTNVPGPNRSSNHNHHHWIVLDRRAIFKGMLYNYTSLP